MGALSTTLSSHVNQWRNLLFPPTCVFCRTPLEQDGSSCDSCAADIRIWPRSRCLQCGRVLSEHLAPGPCGHCLKKSPPQDCTENLFIYRDGPVRNAILDWKLYGHDAGILWLLDAAGPQLQTLLGPRSLLLPVPMPLSRMRRAGRHHTADLCKTIVRQTGAQFDWQVLRRNGRQQRQSALNGRARWKNLCKAFRIDHDYWSDLRETLCKSGSEDMQVWVVDDIITTGATMHYACRALRRAGIKTNAFSLARLAGRN